MLRSGRRPLKPFGPEPPAYHPACQSLLQRTFEGTALRTHLSPLETKANSFRVVAANPSAAARDDSLTTEFRCYLGPATFAATSLAADGPLRFRRGRRQFSGQRTASSYCSAGHSPEGGCALPLRLAARPARDNSAGPSATRSTMHYGFLCSIPCPQRPRGTRRVLSCAMTASLEDG